MIFDTQLLASDAQSVAATGNNVSTNSIDMSSSRDVARRSVPLRARLSVDVAFTRAAGALNTNFQLIESPNSDLSSPTVLYDSGAIPKATAVAGYVPIDIVVPRTSKQYVGFRVVNDAVGDAGSVTAGLLLDTDTPVSDRVLGVTGY